MSEYGYDDDRRSHRSHRVRDRDPEYARETTYIERGSGDLVYRPRDDGVEDIPRKFPPPGSDYGRSSRHAPRSSRGYDDDYYSDRGYARDPPRRSRRKDDGYYSEEHDRPRRERRKSVGDQLKELGEGFGLGGVIGAVTGKDRSRSRSRGGYGRRDRDRRGRYSSSSSRSRSRSRGGGGHRSAKWEQAAKAAVVAGAVEAFRSRKTPGPWTGEKGQRIATAALGAAGIDKVVGRGDHDDRSKRHIAESALGGLVANRLANGSRSRSRGGRGRSDSRSRSRSRSRSIFGRSKSRGRDGSRSRSKIRDVAGAGAVMAAGKAIYDRVRSKSRARKDRSRSVSSDDSYVPSRGRRYDRQKDSQGYNDERAITGPAVGAGAMTTNQSRGRDASASSESTTDLESKRKKLRGKELLTAGFATVATIHAAHGVYNSMVASEKRRKLVAGGEMTPEVARKQKSKNMLQDAAAVGIAALGIKGAFSEWKEMNEQRHQCHELETKRRKRRKEKERRDREARQQAVMYPVANPAYAVPYTQSTSYPDSNPYAAGQVPPPPIGGGGSVRY